MFRVWMGGEREVKEGEKHTVFFFFFSRAYRFSRHTSRGSPGIAK